MRNFSYVNMNGFRENLRTCNWRNVIENNDVNASYDIFWNDFSMLFDLHFPIKKVKFNKNVHKKNDFMTLGLLTSRNTKNELHKKALQNPELFIGHYKKFRNIYNSLVKLSKQKAIDEKFKKFRKNPKKTWDFLKEVTFGEKNYNTITEIDSNGKLLNEPKQIAEEFYNFFSNVGTSIADSVKKTEIKPESYIENYSENLPKFSLGNTGPIHVSDIIKSFDNKASPDLDGLSLKLIKFIAIEISVPLSHIFNLSLDLGIFPEKLKYSRTVPIFKQGDPKHCDNPISLVNTLSKILEKIVALNLVNHLQINKLLYQHQYGFQRAMSTEHNLLHVVNFISNALNNGNYCIGIFLDLKKAFDTCSHSILLKKLEKFGVEGTALAWFASYLKNRKQKVDIAGSFSDESIFNISVLQGSILGPTLFLCYINDIFKATKLATFLFADDTSCLAEHSNLNELISFVNIELQKLACLFKSNKMAVNISKTKYIIFRNKGKNIDPNCPPVVFNNNDICEVQDPDEVTNLTRVQLSSTDREHQTYKLLGVHFDEYLNFEKHISYIRGKLSRSLYCIKRVCNKLSLKSLKSLYFALIHPHLLYCINIVSCANKSNLKSLEKLQKKAIRIITKSKSNEHTGPLFSKVKILPFEKLILQAKLNFMHSIYYEYSPISFKNVFLKNNNRDVNYVLRNRDDYTVPYARTETFKKFPLYTFPSAWNNAGDVVFHRNKVTFQIALKDQLLADIQN